MATFTNRGIPLSSVCPRNLHTNSTSHTWPFSAIAELIDNAYDPDVSAKQFWINKTMIKGQDCLIFMDNGKGMDYDEMHKMLSFGFSDKQVISGHVPVGLYGNGFKSGSMRLGKDAIVFSKKAGSMCLGLLSQTYLEAINTQNVIVPIVMFTKTGQTVSAVPEYDILKYSLFNTKEELLSEFSVIDGLCTNSSGTRIIIWNLHRTSSGQLELDFMKDCYDIHIPLDVYKSTRKTKKQELDVSKWMPESEYSLRAYCSILYLKPRMQIIIQGQKVETQFVTKSLANVFKDKYKPACLKNAIPITFGYNTKSKDHYGLMMYHKNRLIKAYERVPCQRKAESTGVGVIGVIECNYLIPTHNKQAFDNTEEYRKTMLSVGNKLEEYWKEVRYRLKKTLNCTEPVEDIVKRPDQIWVQCDDCLKWRKLPDCIDPKQLPKQWFCRMNSDPQFRSCSVKEEAEESKDEQSRYQKTYKQDEKKQKQEQKMLQSTSSSTHMTPKPSDNTSNDVPKRIKKVQDLSQESPEKKKARRKDLSTCSSAMFSPEAIKSNSEDKQNYEMLCMEAMEEIKQRKEHGEQANKELNESLKTDNEKVEDQGVKKKTKKDLQSRFLCSHAGQFNCKVTSLVFEMKGNGEVVYKLVSWDKSQLQAMGQYHPAGPLYNIKCSKDSIHYLHLPHCEIHTDINVAHFREGKMEILKPLKVTDTHVIIEVQHLSCYGLLKKLILRERPINAQVVVFYQIMRRRRKLHIHLLPGNVPIEEVQNQHEGNTYIQCTSLCQLIPGRTYSPLCEPYVSQPTLETFGYDYGPNYHPTFEVILNTEVEDLTLSLLDEFGQVVWGPRRLFTGAEFVDKHRDVLIQRVSSVMEIADTLLTKKFISIEWYNNIKEGKTNQEKMRMLYSFLDSEGKALKLEFYKVLKKKQKLLVEELLSRCI